MADCDGGNECTTRCGSSCCCDSNYRATTERGGGECNIISELEGEEEEEEEETQRQIDREARNALESTIQMYARPFSETPDIFKAHIPTSSNSCYTNYHDSSHEKWVLGSHVPFDESIGPFSGNLNVTSRPHRGNMCHTGSSIVSSSSITSEQPFPSGPVDVASLSTASTCSSVNTSGAATSLATGSLFAKRPISDLSATHGDHYSDYSLLTPLSIFTDATSDSRNDFNTGGGGGGGGGYLLGSLNRHTLAPNASETPLITSSTSSSTALPIEMDLGCVSSFDQKLYQAFTSRNEDASWNRFHGSLNSSLGRKYSLKSPVPAREEPECTSEVRSVLPSSIAKEERSESEKSAKVTNSTKTFRSVRRWMRPASRQVFSVTNAIHVSNNTASDCSSYVDESNYRTSGHRDTLSDTFCSPFKLSPVNGKKDSRKRSNRCILLIGLFLLSFTILVTSCGFVFNHLVNRMARGSRGDMSHFVSRQRQYWWRDSIFYEIFPASFRDTDGDGYGDLKGVTSKLSYIKDLGATGIRLNSIFTALDYPHQFDHVIDFNSVDPKIGSRDDLKNLVKQAHEHSLTVILDINPSVTSDQHPWAISWLANKSSEYSSFYVITSQNDKPLDVTSTTAIDREGKDLEETHLSFGGHLYLNWSHPGVRIKMMETFKFWLDLGVDGFYLKNLHCIQVTSVTIISEILDDLLEILSLDGRSNGGGDDDREISDETDAIKSKYYTKRQVMTFSSSMDATPPQPLHSQADENDASGGDRRRSKVINDHNIVDDKRLGKRILIANRMSIETLTHRKRHETESKFFKPIHSTLKKASASVSGNDVATSVTFSSAASSSSIADNIRSTSAGNLMSDRKNHFLPSSSTLTSVDPAISLQSIDFFSYFHLIDVFLDIRMNETENIRDQVNEIFLSDLTRSHPWVLWNIGSSSHSRLATRIGSEFVAAASFLLAALPGSISLFYGDEIGLTNSYHSLTNKEFRGGQLAPMSWSTGSNGNFTQSSLTAPWIPFVVNGVNVERSSEAIRRFQHLTTFRRYNFISHSVEKHGNYLFHYINDGEIVLERYFSKRDSPRSHLQLSHQPNKISHMSSLDTASASSSSLSLSQRVHSSSRDKRSPSSSSSTSTSTLYPFLTRSNSNAASSAVHAQIPSQIDQFTLETIDNAHSSDQMLLRARRTPTSSSSSASSLDDNQVFIRSRFVLFANLARAERSRDFRDKFHSGSIAVTSNAKRMRDFLYLRSLKLDPGEAIIAQVE